MVKKIAVIGAGNMGTALLRGILASGWGTKANLIASHPKPSKCAALMIAVGAISFFLRPSPADLAATSAPPSNPAATTGEVRTGAASLPADYLDICRAAGL